MKLNKILKVLIILAIMANGVGMFFPALLSTFIPYYGSIAKHMVVSNDWVDLVLSGKDWLDKPHFPFWMSAISFKIFGINSFAYILPGFLFFLLGVYYTYKLAKCLYDKTTGLISALFSLTALHLMLSSSDVRAEAYLIGQIMPACYYWFLYDKDNKYRYLLYASIFTAFALMTKGIFVLITIVSGLGALWIYKGQWKNFISIKWISALVLSFIFIFPELLSLYLQFDIHPEKVVFGHTQASGISWYFWDSQFGRFFNTGPIMINIDSKASHYFYFFHIFLWAYLPWWPLFIIAILTIIYNYSKTKIWDERDIYLLASFFTTFTLFSLTSFQVDHYTNIIFPFASIICAAWFVNIIKRDFKKSHLVYYIECIFSIILLFLITACSYLTLDGIALKFILILELSVGLLILTCLLKKYNWKILTLVFPAITMSVTMVALMFINGIAYAKYDAGYQMAKYLNQNIDKEQIVGYDIDLLSLDFYSNNPYMLINNKDELFNKYRNNKSFYLVTKNALFSEIKKDFPNAVVIKEFAGCRIEAFLANITDKQRLDEALDHYIIFKVD